MQKAHVLVLLAGLLLISPAASAQPSPAADRNLILTEGSADVTGRNDSASVTIAVETSGRNLKQVGAANAAAGSAVIKALKALNLEALVLTTADYRMTPQRDYDLSPPRIKGYEVANSITATLEGLAPDQLAVHVSEIIEKALEQGANRINQVQFYIKDRAPLENLALTRATREAITRAETLAAAAGIKLKRIVSLSTGPMQRPGPPPVFRSAGMKAETAAMAPPIEPGESRIRVQVSLVYEIE